MEEQKTKKYVRKITDYFLFVMAFVLVVIIHHNRNRVEAGQTISKTLKHVVIQGATNG